MGSRKLELVDCQCTLRVTLLLSSVLESRNLKMKVVLLLFAMIVVAFGQEADEGWEETPPADPPVEESKYKTDKYGKKPYGYKPKYDHKPKYGYQPPKPYGYQPPKPYGGYGYNKKPVYGGYGNYGPKPTYGHDSYGYQKPTYGQESYGYKTPTYGGYDDYGYKPTYGQESYGYQTPTYGGYDDYGYKPTYGQDSYGYQKPTYGGYDNYGYKPTYGHNSYGYQQPMYGGYQKHSYGNSYGYKKPYGKKYDSSHVDNTIKKVGEYADAQEDYKTQSALCITDTETNILSNTGTVIRTRTDTKHLLTVTKGHLTDTRNLDMVKSPTVTNPNTEKSLRRTKIGRNRKKRPMKMAIGRTTLTKIGKNKNIAKIKKSFS